MIKLWLSPDIYTILTTLQDFFEPICRIPKNVFALGEPIKSSVPKVGYILYPLIRLEGLKRYDARCFVDGKLTIGGLIQDIAEKYWKSSKTVKVG